jgi:hypothetical protein
MLTKTDMKILKFVKDKERFNRFLEELLENYDSVIEVWKFELLKKEIDKKFEQVFNRDRS